MRGAPLPFTLRQAQYALAVAAHGGFRAGAEACHVSQPSLSAQLAALEESLGVTLFERSSTGPRGIVVTAEGAEVLKGLAAAVAAAEAVVEAAAALRDPEAGALTVGVLPTIAPYLLAEAAPALATAFPRLAVTFREGTTAELVAAVRGGDLDGAILAREADLGGLAVAVVGRDPFLLAAPSSSAFGAASGPVPLAAIAEVPILILADGHCLGDQALAACQGVGGHAAAFRATSLATLLAMVTAGAGCTLLPALAARGEGHRAGIVVRPVAEAPGRTIVFAFREGTHRRPLLRKLAKLLTPLVTG